MIGMMTTLVRWASLSSLSCSSSVHGFDLSSLSFKTSYRAVLRPQEAYDSYNRGRQHNQESFSSSRLISRRSYFATTCLQSKQESDDDTTTATIVTPTTASINDDVSLFATDYHAPVMWKECVQALLGTNDDTRNAGKNKYHQKRKNNDAPSSTSTPKENQTGRRVFVDGTLGGGGHSAALLDQLNPGDILFGCDVDPQALAEASLRLKDCLINDDKRRMPEGPLFVPVETNFANLQTVLPPLLKELSLGDVVDDDDNKEGVIDGILLDFGVSSHQIDTPERGFAFMKDGPLDMRMGGTPTASSSSPSTSTASSSPSSSYGPLTAAHICNEFDESEIQRILSRYGDEPRAKTVAKAIVRHRPLSTTQDLVQAIHSVTPAHVPKKNKRRSRTATCARVFQSLRIVVNQEDRVLEQVLVDACPALLKEGGRLVVLSYHSMEDRATKRIMRDGDIVKKATISMTDRDVYGNYIGPPKPFRPLGKAQKASEAEIEINPRARSAVLRVAAREPRV